MVPLLVPLIALGLAVLASDNKGGGASSPGGAPRGLYEERGGLQYVPAAARGAILATLRGVCYAPQPGYQAGVGGTVLPTAAPPSSPSESAGAWAEREAAAGRFVLLRSADYPAELRSVTTAGLEAERGALGPGGPWGVLLEPGGPASPSPVPGIPGLVLPPPGAQQAPAPAPALPWLPPSGDFPKMPENLPTNLPGIIPGIPGIVPTNVAAPGPAAELPGLADVPESQRGAVVALLSDPSATPEQLETMANVVGASSPKAAEALRALAAARRAAKVAGAVAEGKTYTIRSGSWPAGVASYYTGDGSRYKELVAIGENKLAHGGQFGVTGWDVGKVIQLPASWPKKPEPTSSGQLLGSGQGSTPKGGGFPKEPGPGLTKPEIDAIADKIKRELDKADGAEVNS